MTGLVATPAPRELASASTVALARSVMAQHAKTFRIASWFLPTRGRADAAIIYAFCRLVDDAADTAESPQVGRRRLAEIRSMLRGESEPSDLIRAYRDVAERLGFGLDPAWSLLQGAESDLSPVRLWDDAELLTYCYRVAGTVGLMMCGALGVSSEQARVHAVQLGVAMQLTNICRDVREDAELGRVYLPRVRLLAAGLSSRNLDPLALLLTGEAEQGALARAVLGVLREAERTYALAARGFRYIPARERLAVMIAARLYRAIGRRLEANGGQALAGRTFVPAWQKAALVVVSLGQWLLGLVLPDRLLLLLGGDGPPAQLGGKGNRPPQASAHLLQIHPRQP